MTSTILANDDVATVLRTIPVAPRILSDLSVLLQRPDVDLGEIIVVLRRDPALARGLLAAANSPQYIGEERLDSLDAVVARLGQRDSFRVAGAVVAAQLYRAPLPLYGMSVEQLRCAALFTGLVMEQLAVSADLDPYGAYVTGLMRSAGKVILNAMAVRTAAVAAYAEDAEPLADWESARLGYTNTEIAAEVLQVWQLPDTIIQAVRDHYTPTEHAPVETHLLAIATGATEARGYGFPGEAEYGQTAVASLLATHLNQTLILSAAEKAQRVFDRLAPAIGVVR